MIINVAKNREENRSSSGSTFFMLARKYKDKSELFALHTSNNCIGSLPTSEQTQYHDDTYFTEFVALFACARACVSVCCFNFFQSADSLHSNADSDVFEYANGRFQLFNSQAYFHIRCDMLKQIQEPSQASPNDSQLYICKLTIGKSATVFHSIRFAFRITT